MLDTFITIIVCTMTGFAILVTGQDLRPHRGRHDPPPPSSLLPGIGGIALTIC